MAVTEYATLHCTADNLTPELRGLLIEGNEIQDKWCAEHQPAPSGSARTGFSYMFQQVENPAVVLLARKWPSVAAHWEWIAGDANKAVMATVMPHIAPDKVVLFHVEGEIFTEPEPDGGGGAQQQQLLTPLIDSPIISVERMFVPSSQRAAFAAKFAQVSSRILSGFAKPSFAHRGGWRADKEAEDKEEFVLYAGWDSIEQHAEFAKSAEYPRYAELAAPTEGSETKHYRRFH